MIETEFLGVIKNQIQKPQISVFHIKMLLSQFATCWGYPELTHLGVHIAARRPSF